jgi:fumarylpyruvate hydrolase
VTYIFTPPPTTAVPVSDNDALFAVNRIYCVGQNYSDHVKEMGGDPKQNPPIFFSKPANAIVTNNQSVIYPQATSELHHEVELVVAIGSGGKAIPVAGALANVYGYAVGVDFTRRDLQLQAKQGGKPWDVAKGFDQSAPISAIRPVGEGPHPEKGLIQLAVNGELRQQGDLSQMIWSVAEIIAALSNLFELKTGDLIFTGTPAGVSAVNAGDRIEASVENVGELAFDLVDG